MNNLIAAASGVIGNPALGQLENNTGESYFQKAVPAAIGMAFLIGSVIFFFMLILGSIQWISSNGDKQALETARARITNALVGMVLAFAAFALIKVIESFFHIHILTLDIAALGIR